MSFVVENFLFQMLIVLFINKIFSLNCGAYYLWHLKYDKRLRFPVMTSIKGRSVYAVVQITLRTGYGYAIQIYYCTRE